RLRGKAALHGEQVDSVDASDGERLPLDEEAVGPELPLGPARRAAGARRSGGADRIRRGELRREPGGGVLVEGGREVRRGERGRPGDAEGEDEQGGADGGEPHRPVQAPVDGALEGAGTGAAPLRRGRAGSHGVSLGGPSVFSRENGGSP